MAKQESPFPLSGALGKITFYKRNGVHMARVKSGASGSKIKTSQIFARTRENLTEFGNAISASKVVRSAFKSMLKDVPDGTVANRLTASMMKALKADATHDRGLRTVQGGNLALIEGFQFNSSAGLETILTVAPTTTIDRATGQCSVGLASFVPKSSIVAPDGATHYKIIAGAVTIDFKSVFNVPNVQSTAELPIDSNPTAAINLQLTVAANSTTPIVVAAGIVFYQVINGKEYVLSGFNAMQVLKVLVS